MSGRLTLIDAMQDNLVLGGIVVEHAKAVPALGRFPVFTIPHGIKYSSQFMVELPTTGFRALGQGRAPSKGRYEEREFRTHLFSGRAEAEIAAYAADSGGETAVKGRVVRDTAQSAMETLDNQIFYGTAADDAGFPGLKQFTPFGGAYTYDVGGSTANGTTSVYGVKFGEDYARLDYAKGDPFNLAEWRRVELEDEDGDKYPGEAADLEGWIGLAIKHKASVLRLCNITAQTGKGVTDLKLRNALLLLPTKMQPDVWFMNKTTLAQLQDSRATPEVPYAPIPTESNGIPIVVDDSILSTDAVEA